METALSLRGIHLSYGDYKVIDGLDLDVGKGEIFGFIGLNGEGKTTLIKALLGLRESDKGTIEINGKNRLDPETKKFFSYLPERFDPPWFLSGLEFLRFSMSFYKAPFDRAAIEAAAQSLALRPEVLSARVQTYSKGMRQKLGILATLLTGCPLLVLDEPMSGLDPRARALVKDALSKVREQGRTVFFTSHILSDMNEMCDRVAVLNKSKLVYSGTPEGLRKAGGSDSLEKAFLALIDSGAKAA